MKDWYWKGYSNFRRRLRWRKCCEPLQPYKPFYMGKYCKAGSKYQSWEWNVYSKDNVLIGYEGKSEKLVVPEGITTIANNVIKGEGYNPDSKIAKEIVIPDTVKVIEDRAFFSRYNLEKVTLPKNLTEIGDYAFFECNIKEIEIPNTITKWGKNVFSSLCTWKSYNFQQI